MLHMFLWHDKITRLLFKYEPRNQKSILVILLLYPRITMKTKYQDAYFSLPDAGAATTSPPPGVAGAAAVSIVFALAWPASSAMPTSA